MERVRSSDLLGLLAARRAKLVLLITVAVWGLVDVQRRARIDPDRPQAHRTDLTVYTEAGAAFFDGRNPYEVTNPRGWHYLYPPLFALLLSPLSFLPTRGQAIVWFAVNVALAYLAIRECNRLIRWARGCNGASALDDNSSRPPPSWLVLCAFLAVLFPTLNCLQRGQAGLAVLYPLLLGLRWALERDAPWKNLAGGVVLALPIAFKLTPALPVCFLIFLCWVASAKASRNASARPSPKTRAVSLTIGVGTGVALWLLLLPSLVLGWKANWSHLETWKERVVDARYEVGALNNFNTSSWRNQSLSNALDLAFPIQAPEPLENDGHGAAHQRPLTTVIVVVALALLALSGGFTANEGYPVGLLASFGLSCAATLIVSPVSWGHHYVMELPAVLFVPLALWFAGHRRTAVVFAVLPLVLSLGHYLSGGKLAGWGFLGIGTTLWIVGACGALFATARATHRPV